MQCSESIHPFNCTTKSSDNEPQCTYGTQVCDTIANCPDGSDESFDMCQDYFSELATVTCTKADTFNFNITIKATACDGNIECADGRDEKGCSLPDETIFATFAFIYSTIIVITLILWIKIKGRLRLKRPGYKLTSKEFYDLHGSQALQTRVSHWQGLEFQKCSNQDFYKMELVQHGYDINSTICCLKVIRSFLYTASMFTKLLKPLKTFRTAWT